MAPVVGSVIAIRSVWVLVQASPVALPLRMPRGRPLGVRVYSVVPSVTIAREAPW
ncbi:hypothetical protein [Actinokineospora pegani]|uniref:hypothetical protein n=1 Tax=Actinokineospora pegani TaxID=2654637 RepID=UPI001F269B49|nr:hypothetical protein [Actinokineospora pegani]